MSIVSHYKVINCFDENLEFLLNIGNIEVLSDDNVITLDIEEGESLVYEKQNFCNDSIRITHPDINNGNFVDYSNLVSVLQDEKYNDKPYYKLTLDESVHGVPGLEFYFYIVYNNVTERWEWWDTFDLVNGFSNTLCDEQSPYLYLEGLSCEGPISISGCNWISPNFSTPCAVGIGSNRTTFYCPEEVILTDFINCWTLSEIEDNQPFPLPTYDILESSEDCGSCVTPKLQPPCLKVTECFSGETDIIDFIQDLEPFIGKVVKVLAPLPTGGFIEKCYKIELSPVCEFEPLPFNVNVIDCYSECEDCLPECRCTRAVNNGASSKKLTYIDCEYNVKETEESVAPGKTSKKYCVIKWLDPDVTEVLDFGKCIDGTCPETPKPKKVVKPGYNTPLCTPETYERIVCRYSEHKYKEMLDKRFGIENCCPDETLQSDIKFELIHMQILKDPDYVCNDNVNKSVCKHCY